MGRRFKDKHSIREEKKEKKQRKQKVEKIPKTEKSEKIEKKTKKKSGKKMVVFFLVIIIILTIPAIYWRESNNIVENTITNVEPNYEVTNENMTEIVDADIPDTMGDYNVIGKIIIDKIGVEKNILDQTTDASLKLSVTKFYGPGINEEGNLCISGHNYKDTFGYLGKMEKDDTFYIIDKVNFEKVIYRIYDKFTVNSTELDCLDQETEGKREVTLITCNPGGVTRLIIKACEI